MFARVLLMAVVVGVGTASASAANERAGTLPLEECVRMALREHPQLHAAAAMVDGSRQRVRQAASGFLPQVAGEYAVNRQSSTLGAIIGVPPLGSITSAPGIDDQTLLFNFQRGMLSLSQLLFDFGKTLNATRAATADVDSAQSERQALEQRVALNVKRAYFDLIAARRLLEVAEGNEANTREHLAEAMDRLGIGLGTSFDVRKQSVQVANAELATLTARNNVALGRENLRHAMGLRQPIAFEADDTALDYVRVVLDEPSAIRAAEARRPELQRVYALERAQQERIAALKKDYLPVIGGNARYAGSGSDGPEQESWFIGGSARLTIFNGGQTAAKVAEARADLLRLEGEKEAARQLVEFEVRHSLLNLTRAGDALRVSATAAEEATASLALARHRYSAGLGNVLELTDAQNEVANAQANHVRLLADYRIALADLEHATATQLVRNQGEAAANEPADDLAGSADPRALTGRPAPAR